MFYPARMKRARLVVHKAYLAPLVAALHEAGIMQVIDIREAGGMPALERAGRERDADRCTRLIAAIEGILGAFTLLESGSGSLFRELFVPEPAEERRAASRGPEELFREAEAAVREAEGAVALKAALLALIEEKAAMERRRHHAELLLPFGLDLGHLGGTRFLFTGAWAAGVEELEKAREALGRIKVEEMAISERRVGEHAVFLITVPAAARGALEEAMNSPPFRRIEAPSGSGTPGDALRSIEERERALEVRQKEIRAGLEELAARCRRRLLACREELEIQRERFEAGTRFGALREAMVVCGWCPERRKEALVALAERATEGHVSVSFVPGGNPDGRVPTLCEHPGWLRPFGFLTRMYAIPRHNEIDPTPFLAPVFLFFFGMMLGDAAYGAIIALAGILILRGAGSRSGTMRDMALVFTACGLSAVIFGVLQGGYFGDLLPRFLGFEPPLVLLRPLEEPLVLFELALVIGLAHLNLGLVLGLVQLLRERAWREVLLRKVPWFILQPCAAVLLLGFFRFASFQNTLVWFSAAGALLAVLLLLADRGPLAFFGLTGFLGDWLSYVRILALALATGGIAMTVNILAEMIAGGSPFLLPAAIAVFVIGQCFNLVIQTLGGLVHAIRLHYIEFFGKFYEGGGIPFSPFRAERRYTFTEGGV